MTVQELIDNVGLKGILLEFGWQGGTVHQAKREIIKRLRETGIVQDKNGDLVSLTINGPNGTDKIVCSGCYGEGKYETGAGFSTCSKCYGSGMINNFEVDG